MMHRHIATLSALATCMAIGQAAAEPVTFAIDNEHTHLVWSVDRFGFTQTVASFADISGTLILDEDAPESAHVTAVIAVESVRSDLAERETVIQGPFWLDVEQFPTIRFTSTAVDMLVGTGPATTAKVTGDLALHGVTAPVSFDVTLNKIGTDPVTGGRAAGFSASGTLSRQAFGVTTALGPIGDEVRFTIEALAIAPATEDGS